MGWTPHAVTTEAIQPIKDYCENRNYKCKGCRYSIKYINPQYDGLMCCVFANCPCDWEVPKEIHKSTAERKWVMSL